MTTKDHDGLSEAQRKDFELRERAIAAQEEGNRIALAHLEIAAKTRIDGDGVRDERTLKNLRDAGESYRVHNTNVLERTRLVRIMASVAGVAHPSTVGVDVQETRQTSVDPHPGRWRIVAPIWGSWDTTELEKIAYGELYEIANPPWRR
jgi:phosphoribosylformimino-5-aminoimidazole carboxamide ribonucleotide (ProFAR) isomerase